MSEQRNVSYEDDDLRQVIDEIETMDAQCETIMARARGEVSGIRAKQKARKKIAAKELGIPRGILLPLLKRRKLEKQIAKVDEGVDDDLAEVYEDARGQLSFLAPVTDAEPEVEPDKKGKSGKKVDASASDAALKQSIADVTAKEQAEGEKLLNGAGKGKPHDAVGFTDAR